MLHLDGSRHCWLSLVPEAKQTLIQVVDDATSRLLYAQLWPGETTRAVMTAMRDVVRRERFLPTHNEEFVKPPADPTSAFVGLDDVDLDEIFFEEAVRKVGTDNTVGIDGLLLQIEKQAARRTCARLAVQVRRHLDGGYTIRRGAQLLGVYDPAGRNRTTVSRPTTHQDAAGTTQGTRVDSRVVPTISTYRPAGRPRGVASKV